MIDKLFLSMAAAIFWFLVFAVACGAGSFIESYYDTPTAWAVVYGTAWFGFVQVILGLNLLYNIFAYKLTRLNKLPALIFHASFLLMLIGAGLTRYIGAEGIMHIRNGESSNEIRTSMSYIQLKSIENNSSYVVSKPMYLSKTIGNDFALKTQIAGKDALLKYDGFVPNALYKWQESSDGEAILELVFSNDKNSRSVVLKSGDELNAGDIFIGFNTNASVDKYDGKYIVFSLENSQFMLKSNLNISQIQMGQNETKSLANNEKNELKELSVYTFESGGEKINFSVKTMLAKGKQTLVSAGASENGVDAIKTILSYDGKDYPLDVFVNDKPTQFIAPDGVVFEASFNPMKIDLPFSLELEKFEMLRYAGSSSPMSYSSFVKVKDGDESYDYHIYMNHVLDHGGYRFFQSSYDMDEGGTVLSVNKDPGKWPTYIAYFMLGLGLFLNLISPNSRFIKLSKLVASQNESDNNTSLKKGAKTLSVVVLALFALFSTDLKASELEVLPKISPEHANIAKTLIVQSNDGRMKPFDTLANELLNKLYRSSSFNGMDANEAVLSMTIAPALWRSVPLIKISDPMLKEFLGLKNEQKYASFDDFFITKGESSEYKLLAKSEEANRKPLSARTTIDKEIIKADEKVNILYMIFAGEFLRIFPGIDDPNNTWYSPTSAISTLNPTQSADVLNLLQNYFGAAAEAINNNNWQKANEAMEAIKAYQIKHGAAIMPSPAHIKAELAFNKYKIFANLVPVYLIAGLALLIVVFIRLGSSLRLNAIFKVVYVVNILAFIAHTAGLALRWYISGHAPWSDSYESLVYIAWALALSGIVFSRRSAISLALTAILAGCVLFVAHLSWIDPQITNLQPVLRSYWLTIHVSVITASYGFLGLCSLLGIFTLVLFAMQGKSENSRLSANILEATRINEMAMILGLSLLTFGNFLGGVWANESWGRYWGWDSKETWALVSILVYAAVLHMRFVRPLNSQYAFAVASMFAYWVIVFTYFGVNFYLTGMHSYAAGDAVQVPAFVYIIAFAMIAISLIALRGKRYNIKL